jgi:hypothetical protein
LLLLLRLRLRLRLLGVEGLRDEDGVLVGVELRLSSCEAVWSHFA